MLTIIGLLIIRTIVSLLILDKTNPIIAMSIVPLFGALLAGYSFSEISAFVDYGLQKVSNVAAMFMFAILFFSLMKDLHIFNPFIRLMIGMTRGNPIIVAMVTALVAAVVHLDGSGAATFLIIIPALLPLYRKLGMSPYLMLLIMCISMGVMNMVPWGGPLGRASAVTGIPAEQLWHPLIPVQIMGVIASTLVAGLFGWREKKRITQATLQGLTPCQQDSLFQPFTEVDNNTCTKQPQKFLVNISLVVAVVISLAFGFLSAPYIFILALSLALVINFPHAKDQVKVISQHAPQALTMAAIILSAGIFLGILDKGEMLESIARDLLIIIPANSIHYFHIIIGFLGVPLDIFTSTDAYYFALLPIIQNMMSTAGISAQDVVYAMTIGNNAGTFVSPFSPAVWLAVGIAGVDMGRHIRYSFLWIWLFSFITLGIGYSLGLF